MKVELVTDGLGRGRFAVQPDIDDAWPRWGEVVIDSPPRDVRPDRLALASVLLHRGTCGGHLTVPGQLHPASVQVLHAQSPHRWNNLQPVEHRNRATSGGPVTVALDVAEGEQPAQRDLPEGCQSRLTILRSDMCHGGMSTLRHRVVVSNALVPADLLSPQQRLDRVLGIALLQVDEMDARELRFTAPSWANDDMLMHARRLLGTVGVALSWTRSEA